MAFTQEEFNNTGPRLCRDIYESNVNGLIGDLRKKLSAVQLLRSSAKSGGDYEHTCGAYVRTLRAAIDAAEIQFQVEIARDKKTNPPTQKGE